MGTTAAIEFLGIDSMLFVWCRGMLAVPSVGRSAAVHADRRVGNGDEQNAGGCSPIRPRNCDSGGEAWTSAKGGKAAMGGDCEEVGV